MRCLTPVSTVFARTANSSQRCSAEAMSGKSRVAQSLSRWKPHTGVDHLNVPGFSVSTTAGSDIVVFQQNSATAAEVAARGDSVWLSWQPEHSYPVG